MEVSRGISLLLLIESESLIHFLKRTRDGVESWEFLFYCVKSHNRFIFSSAREMEVSRGIFSSITYREIISFSEALQPEVMDSKISD